MRQYKAKVMSMKTKLTDEDRAAMKAAYENPRSVDHIPMKALAALGGRQKFFAHITMIENLRQSLDKPEASVSVL